MLYFKINTGYIFLPTCLVDGPEDKKGGEQAACPSVPFLTASGAGQQLADFSFKGLWPVSLLASRGWCAEPEREGLSSLPYCCLLDRNADG